VKRAGIAVGIAFIIVAVVSIIWPARTPRNQDRDSSRPAQLPGTVTPSPYTPVFMGLGGLTPHDSDPLRLAWIDRYGSSGRWVLYTGMASILSPPDSQVTLVGDVREGERVLAWGEWGFLLAGPSTDDDDVVRVLDPTGSPLAEAGLDR
jgi:hypothetical protein